jgi:hypothetical protein
VAAVVGGAIVAVLVGLALIVAGLSARRTNRARERGWLEATGEIVELMPGDINAARLHPVARYQREDGSVGQVRDSVATQPPRFRVGDRVQVRYDPADPAQASIGAGGAAILPSVLIGLGAFVLVLALVIAAAASAVG